MLLQSCWRIARACANQRGGGARWPNVANSITSSGSGLSIASSCIDGTALSSSQWALRGSSRPRRQRPATSQQRCRMTMPVSDARLVMSPPPRASPAQTQQIHPHLKHGLAGSGRSIETLLMQEQIDSFFMETLEYAQQVGERSTEPIHRPCRDHAEFFRGHRFHHGVEPGTLIPPLAPLIPASS
jgi:hypothetical protein